jgi:hypothetical protein
VLSGAVLGFCCGGGGGRCNIGTPQEKDIV